MSSLQLGRESRGWKTHLHGVFGSDSNCTSGPDPGSGSNRNSNSGPKIALGPPNGLQVFSGRWRPRSTGNEVRMTPPIFETERLRVRHFEPADLDDSAALCADPRVMRYVGDGSPLPWSEVERWIEVCQKKYAALAAAS
jgi:hypothetical protein